MPRLTDEAVQRLPRVQDFKRQFTEDLQSSLRQRIPYGIVRRITCYEAVPGGTKPIRQPGSTSIWRPDATQVVFELLHALIPRINRKHADEDATIAANTRKTNLDEQRARKRRRIAWTGGLVAGLATLGILIWLALGDLTRRQVALLEDVATRLRTAKIASISPETEAGMAGVLATNRGDPENTPAELQSAIGALEEAMNEAAQRLVGAPSVGAPYPAELSRFLTLVPHFDLGSNASLRYVLPQLEARRRFLSDWQRVASQKERRTRTRFLDESAKRFHSAGDDQFVASVRTESTKQKKAETAGWQTKIDKNAGVEDRLAAMQSIWHQTLAEADPELTQLAREYLAEQLIVTFLKQHENDLFKEKLLDDVTPDLAKLNAGQIRFDVFAGGFLACADEEQCRERETVVESAIGVFETNVAKRARSSENLLRNLLAGALPEERTRLWESVANALWGSSLFHAQGDTWPADMRPLARTIEPAVDVTAERTEALLMRIAGQPIYREELLYLYDHLRALDSSRRAVPIYQSLLSGLGTSYVLETFPLDAVAEEVSSSLAGRSDPGPLGAVGTELNDIRNRVRAVNYGRGTAQNNTQIEEGQLAQTLRIAKHARCELLALHTPPSECADAM